MSRVIMPRQRPSQSELISMSSTAASTVPTGIRYSPARCGSPRSRRELADWPTTAPVASGPRRSRTKRTPSAAEVPLALAPPRTRSIAWRSRARVESPAPLALSLSATLRSEAAPAPAGADFASPPARSRAVATTISCERTAASAWVRSSMRAFSRASSSRLRVAGAAAVLVAAVSRKPSARAASRRAFSAFSSASFFCRSLSRRAASIFCLASKSTNGSCGTGARAVSCAAACALLGVRSESTSSPPTTSAPSTAATMTARLPCCELCSSLPGVCVAGPLSLNDEGVPSCGAEGGVGAFMMRPARRPA